MANLGFHDNTGNILGADSSNNQFSSSNVVANADGSIIERLEAIIQELSGTSGIATFPAGAAAANTVSMAEVLRYIQENIIRGGTVLPATQSLYDLLAGANGIATFPASAVPGNGVSMAEVLRDIWDSLRNGTGGTEPGTNRSIVDEIRGSALNVNNTSYLTVDITFDALTTGSVGTHEILDVSGTVRLRILPICLTDVAGAGSIQLGTSSSTSVFVASTTGTDIDTGDLWHSATPPLTSANFSSAVIDKVVYSADVGYEVTANTLTGGRIFFRVWWEPLSPDGNVVVADGTGAL